MAAILIRRPGPREDDEQVGRRRIGDPALLARDHPTLGGQRDDCAAVDLARYEEPDSVVGPVGAAVKRGADRKMQPIGGHLIRRAARRISIIAYD
jgi:hypothetical protein